MTVRLAVGVLVSKKVTQAATKERSVSRLLPPKTEKRPSITTSFRLPADLLDWLDEISARQGYSRNEAVVTFLNWCKAEIERELHLQARMKAEEEDRLKAQKEKGESDGNRVQRGRGRGEG